MFEITPEEQRRLIGLSGSALKTASRPKAGKTVSGLRGPMTGTLTMKAQGPVRLSP
jgi:hypothetical protein